MYVSHSTHNGTLPLTVSQPLPRGSAKVSSDHTRASPVLTRLKWWSCGCHLRIFGRMAWDDLDIHRAFGAGLHVRIVAEPFGHTGTDHEQGADFGWTIPLGMWHSHSSNCLVLMCARLPC
jgi:hypothetical protein